MGDKTTDNSTFNVVRAATTNNSENGIEDDSNEKESHIKDFSKVVSKINPAFSLFESARIKTETEMELNDEVIDMSTPNCDPSAKSIYREHGTGDDSDEINPITTDFSNVLSKRNQTFNLFGSTCVEVKTEHDDETFTDVSQRTTKQKEIMLPLPPDYKVKDKPMFCQSCSYSDVDFGRLKSHTLTKHPCKATIITSSFGEEDFNDHNIICFCVKETCSFSTTSWNIFEQHLISCCPLHKALSEIERERLKSTITFMLDYCKKYIGSVSGFQDYISHFNKVYLREQREMHENLKYDKSAFRMHDFASISDVESSFSFDNVRKSKENSCSAQISTPVLLVTKQNTDLSSNLIQRDPVCLGEQDQNDEQLTKTDPSLNDGEVLSIQPLFGDSVPKCVKMEIGNTAKQAMYNNHASFSEDIKEELIKHGMDCDANCKKFDKMFAQERNILLHHKGSHDGEKPFKCCESSKNTGPLKTQKAKKRFRCNECCKSFVRNRDLLAHIRRHTGEKPFKCNECGEGFVRDRDLLRHMRGHTGEKPFTCNECGKSFGQSTDCKAHMRIHTGEKPFTCKECGKSFGQNSNLAAHLKTHAGVKPFKCNECGKSFSRSESLITHMRTHTGEKPFKCNECGKCFGQSSTLLSHIWKHTGESPFMCEECGKSFCSNKNLVTHMKIHTGEKPFKCNECGKRFIQNCNLLSHMRRHTGEKPFTCSECGKSFGQNGNLIAHMRGHTGEKPFKCDECGKSFVSRSILTRHMKGHSGERPFQCTECGKSFGRNFSLIRHMRGHREEKPLV